MDRKEIYAKVKEYDLVKKIQEKYGDNYTRVSSKNLEEFITAFEKKRANSEKGKADKNKAPEKCTERCKVKQKESALVKLLSILAAKGIIIPEEAEMVAKLL